MSLPQEVIHRPTGMTGKSPDPEDPSTEDEPDVQRRFQETLGRLVNTPHKPHKSAPKPRKRSGK